MNDVPVARSSRYWAYGALALWAAAAALLLNRTPYGVDESAARAMLLLWSFVEDLANPIVTLGVPDFRAVFLIPAGFAFPGSLWAAKLLTLLIVALTAVALFRWIQHGQGSEADPEAPMLATGVWLLSPLLIGEIDRISVGPFLLCVLIAGAYLDRGYRASPQPFGGRYFALMLLSLAATTLHPAGIAYPAVITATWLARPPSAEPGQSGQTPFLPASARIVLPSGVAAAAICGIWLAGGWTGVSWLGNPVTAAAGVLIGWQGPQAGAGTLSWIVGGFVCVALAVIVWVQRAKLWSDCFGRMAVAACAIGLLCADSVWALFAMVVILYWGFPLLLGLRLPRLPALLRERGLALLTLVAVATLFMSQDRARFALIRKGPELSDQDRLIERLAAVVAQSAPDSKPRVASQWPGRTMVACRCNTLPLPPVAGDEQALLKLLTGIDYVVFDPRYPVNQSLSRNLALLGGESAQTIALQAGGAIIRVNAPREAPQSAAPQTRPEGKSGK